MNYSRKLMNVSSRQLHAFVEICRVRSFVKVAERIHISSSGLSMLVKELEEQVGARLFDRTTRSLSLTEAGRRFQPVAERIIGELLDVGDSIHDAESILHARIDIAATPMVSASLLPSIIKGFRHTHPRLDIRLSDLDVSAVRTRVLEGDADIGLGFFVKPAVGLLRLPLCRFRLMRIGPAVAYGPARRRVRDQRWADLANTELVGLPKDNPIQALIELHLAQIGKAHESRPEVNLLGTLIGMVDAGIGHAIVPSFALGECLRRGLEVAMLVEPDVYLDLFLVSRRGAAAKPAIADFAAMLKQAAAHSHELAASPVAPSPTPARKGIKPTPAPRNRGAG